MPPHLPPTTLPTAYVESILERKQPNKQHICNSFQKEFLMTFLLLQLVSACCQSGINQGQFYYFAALIINEIVHQYIYIPCFQAARFRI